MEIRFSEIANLRFDIDGIAKLGLRNPIIAKWRFDMARIAKLVLRNPIIAKWRFRYGQNCQIGAQKSHNCQMAVPIWPELPNWGSEIP